MKLRKTVPEDLRLVMGWIENEKACRIWAGQGFRFPFNWDNYLEDLGFYTHETFSLVDESENPVGIGQIMQRKNRLHLARILVNPGSRGQGYGRLLCELLITEGRSRPGNKPFSLNVYRHNRLARELYIRLGFKEPEDQSEAVSHDSVFMILEDI